MMLSEKIRSWLLGGMPYPPKIPRAEPELLLLGRILAGMQATGKSPASLEDVEFCVFSQFGDDGIIQWLVRHVPIPNRTFIEFGVENYQEACTRFLLMNNNWSGFVMDGSQGNIDAIRSEKTFWKYDLSAEACFVEPDNVNDLLRHSGFSEDLGLLHIDIDGMDYWVWKAVTALSPRIVILEYNAVFGASQRVTVPYDAGFDRAKAHFSRLYFGASLSALHSLSVKKGYAFLGCNSAGNNAYFVRRDLLVAPLEETSLSEGFVPSKFRESRGPDGALTFADFKGRQRLVEGLPVFHVETEEIMPFRVDP